MNKLVSKQHTNDGAYHIKRLVNEANDRLKQIGRQGKRATLVAKKSSLTLQFTFKDGNGKAQKNVGLGGIVTSANGILEAEKIARMVTDRLVTGEFTWDWYDNLIGKAPSQQNKLLTCKEMVEVYKKHYFNQRQSNKAVDESWYKRCNSIEKILGNENKCLSLSLVRQIVESKDNNSNARTKVINGLVEFLKYFNSTDFKEVIKQYKENNNPKPKKRNVPSDKRIIEVYKNGFIPSPYVKKYRHRYSQWQFLFGLLTTYGLRIHEAWNIANWDKPVTLKDGDWVTVETDNNKDKESRQYNGEDVAVPAILDPNNTEFFLCIKDTTKTGYRIAVPLSPEGCNWIEEFNLIQPLNLPDVPQPLKTTSKSQSGFPVTTATCHWFSQRKYGFTPHDLRHAYNHRGHHLGLNPKALADSLGHTITMNQSGYLRHMSDSVKLKGMKDAIAKDSAKRSENELLREENQALKSQLEAVQKENELLKTKIQLNETYQQSKDKK